MKYIQYKPSFIRNFAANNQVVEWSTPNDVWWLGTTKNKYKKDKLTKKLNFYSATFQVPAKYLGGDVNRLIGQINDPEVNKISIPVSDSEKSKIRLKTNLYII